MWLSHHGFDLFNGFVDEVRALGLGCHPWAEMSIIYPSPVISSPHFPTSSVEQVPVSQFAPPKRDRFVEISQYIPFSNVRRTGTRYIHVT